MQLHRMTNTWDMTSCTHLSGPKSWKRQAVYSLCRVRRKITWSNSELQVTINTIFLQYAYLHRRRLCPDLSCFHNIIKQDISCLFKDCRRPSLEIRWCLVHAVMVLVVVWQPFSQLFLFPSCVRVHVFARCAKFAEVERRAFCICLVTGDTHTTLHYVTRCVQCKKINQSINQQLRWKCQ